MNYGDLESGANITEINFILISNGNFADIYFIYFS